jgi:hypothetical protein
VCWKKAHDKVIVRRVSKWSTWRTITSSCAKNKSERRNNSLSCEKKALSSTRKNRFSGSVHLILKWIYSSWRDYDTFDHKYILLIDHVMHHTKRKAKQKRQSLRRKCWQCESHMHPLKIVADSRGGLSLATCAHQLGMWMSMKDCQGSICFVLIWRDYFTEG